ncbi:cell wall-associated hydrolase, invasion-associated protein [Mycobacteroides abscessus subsp. abscessus]|uniref:C40 family peptidase n=1 Tax=Mycobacteroides abscessus TaxID=36809 RepID=UPI0009270F23|nr:NlpC/P60 family protein [Mycobacteroides abscessus]SIJ21672.1 cell wall-associated hydrolase, invasion-associated protein [Mycobacteroides abscessus subsp. abscessus]SLH38873.1 cell wall-associated hydrolase, invasion-associated protein [Mycobacteroides abscessus subsp. abscessus]
MAAVQLVQAARLAYRHRGKVVALAAMTVPFVVTAMLLMLTMFFGGGEAPAAVKTPLCQQQMRQQGISADAGVSFGPGPINNGKAVIATGLQMKIPEKGIIVALATAMQESGLKNYANPNVPESMQIPHEAVGHDHASVGIFQQQPWWGSIKDLMTPGVAAQKFYAALLKVGGWESMAPTQAAQAVQRSAYPDAYADDVPAATNFYRQHVQEVVAASGGQAPAAKVQDEQGRDLCGALLDPDSQQYSQARTPAAAGVAAAKAAQAQLGLPYIWGGGSLNGPTGGGFDCSGLVRFAIYQGSGHKIVLPRVTWDMVNVGRTVPRNTVQPGDLVFLNPQANPSNGSIGPGHVAMVLNPTTIIEAQTEGVPVKLSPFPTRFMVIKRVL